MNKILALVWKELYTTYTDRNLLLIMLATPLALATIISLAFSQFFSGGGDVPISDIPVAIVNLDRGVDNGGTTFNNGDIFVNALVPPADADDQTLGENVLFELTNTVALSSADEARAGVDDGTYTAAIIIPEDFSQRITYTQDHPTVEAGTVEVYASPASPVTANVVRSIVESISGQLETGNIAIAATLNTLIERARTDPAFGIQFGLAATNGQFQPNFAAAFDPQVSPIAIEQQTVEGQAAEFNPLVSFGAGQAVFFMMFTAMASANALLEERRAWTLQRLVVSPTPRPVILLGRFIATFVNCFVQVTVLLVALTIIGSLVSGRIQFIWGTNLPGIVVTIAAVALAASGLGTLISALVKTPEQGNVVGSIVSLMMGLFGGVFFNTAAIPVLAPLSKLSLVYWGIDAFGKLSAQRGDIGLNLVILLVIGAVFFTAGWLIFNRRLNV